MSLIDVRKLKSMIVKAAANRGYRIERIATPADRAEPYSTVTSTPAPIVDLEQLAWISLGIDGMITPESGKLLYALCVMQQTPGNVVEIGSWQGRSTSFLARAVLDSGNGRFYAVDHFRGNVGKESFYVVDRDDLSDLRDRFEDNMRRVGLWDHVTLLDMPNTEARDHIDGPVRFLFIDGDHTERGVRRDIELFFPLLAADAIVVFDDFTPGFDGLVRAVEDLMRRERFARVFSYAKTLVLMRAK